jgi:hypothetical protein
MPRAPDSVRVQGCKVSVDHLLCAFRVGAPPLCQFGNEPPDVPGSGLAPLRLGEGAVALGQDAVCGEHGDRLASFVLWGSRIGLHRLTCSSVHARHRRGRHNGGHECVAWVPAASPDPADVDPAERRVGGCRTWSRSPGRDAIFPCPAGGPVPGPDSCLCRALPFTHDEEAQPR